MGSVNLNGSKTALKLLSIKYIPPIELLTKRWEEKSGFQKVSSLWQCMYQEERFHQESYSYQTGYCPEKASTVSLSAVPEELHISDSEQAQEIFIGSDPGRC